MRGWLSAGHHIAAIWIPHRLPARMFRRDSRLRLLSPQWSMADVARRHGIPVLEVPPLTGWAQAADSARAVGADALVSAYFSYLVPGGILDLFDGRAVNLHPAPLPRYRGPQPARSMMLDGSIMTDACVTLHAMADRFDTGDIIATRSVAVSRDRMPARLMLAFARAGAQLAASDLPAYLDGQRQALPQDESEAGYCRLAPGAMEIGPHLDSETVRRILDLTLVRSVAGLDGVDVDGLARRIGPSLGQPPAAGMLNVDVDLADGRFRLRRKRPWTKPFRTAADLAIQVMERDVLS